MNNSVGVFLSSITVMLVCSLIITADPVEAVDQGLGKKSSESSKQEMIAAKSMIQDGSRKMMDGAKMLQESMKVMKQGNDKAKATAMMNNAIQILAEGEKIVAEAQEMAKKSPAIRDQMKPMISSCLKMMSGCKLMSKGVGMMVEDKQDRAWAEQTVVKGRKRASEAARKIEWGGGR